MSPENLAWVSTRLTTILGNPLSFGDVAGFATGLACVLLASRGSIWNFPVGIANSLILALVFWQVKLYGDMALQGVFCTLSIIGWRQWQTRGHVTKVPESGRATDYYVGVLVVAGLALPLQHRLAILGGSSPWPDALVTAASLWAQWLLNRHSISSWAWWIAIDLVSIPLYWSKNLPLLSLLYVVFLGLCLQGWRNWHRQLSQQGAQPGAATATGVNTKA